MNPEILQMKGMLAEAKKKYRSLDTEASGLVILIRSLLNPYEEIHPLYSVTHHFFGKSPKGPFDS